MMRWQDIQDMLDSRGGRSRYSNNNSNVSAFLLGATMGVAAGVLLAPRSGQETRAQLRQRAQSKASEVKETTKDRMSQAAEVTRRSVAEGRQAAKDSQERAAARRARGA